MFRLSRNPLFLIVGALFAALLSVAAVPATLAQADATLPEYPAPLWDGQSRFTVLIMGLDRRPDQTDLGLEARTDAIMLASYDPQTGTLGVLSIPRDLHLPVPESDDFFRVNTLLLRGEGRQTGYGPYYAMNVLQYNFGMYIDAFVVFDFDAFTALIDAMDGITVDVPTPINDTAFPDMDYGYDPLVLDRGPQQFDGYDALRYARTRHGDNDYLRGQRQLQVVEAVYDRLGDPQVVQDLIAQAPDLVASLRGKLVTDLPLDLALRLGLVLVPLTPDAITFGAIERENTLDFTQRGERFRIPDREQLANVLSSVFGPGYAG